ncbi:MAG: hypothetical protein AB8G14_01775 [Ilumatobacter sp.]
MLEGSCAAQAQPHRPWGAMVRVDQAAPDSMLDSMLDSLFEPTSGPRSRRERAAGAEQAFAAGAEPVR